ncbi:MAG: formate dehydrogenase accessory sulfurtransferase FdhD [Halothiobacillus sp.]
MMVERNVSFEEGFLLITRRASVEMVQKAATVGMRSLITISAPTAFAVKTAQAAGMTLIAFARGDAFVAKRESVDLASNLLTVCIGTARNSGVSPVWLEWEAS